MIISEEPRVLLLMILMPKAHLMIGKLITVYFIIIWSTFIYSMENLPNSNLRNSSAFKAIIQAIKENTVAFESDLQAIKPYINVVNQDWGFWENTTLLSYAVEFGRKTMVEKLLALGADINRSNPNRITPLMVAAYKGNTEIAQLLLSHHADPTIRRIGIRETASMMAAREGYDALAVFLKNEEIKFRKL